MTATIALIAALSFVAVALYRFGTAAPGVMRTVQLALGLAAGLFGIAVWRASIDSRWLVGGILLLGAGLPGWLAGTRRKLKVTALVLGICGAALYGVATLHPMQRVVIRP